MQKKKAEEIEQVETPVEEIAPASVSDQLSDMSEEDLDALIDTASAEVAQEREGSERGEG